MKKLITLFCCLVTSLFLFGQNREIDSLKSFVNNRKGDRKSELAALQKLVQGLIKAEEIDSASHYCLIGLQYVSNATDSADVDSASVDILYSLGAIYQFQDLDSAILLSSRALEYAARLKYRSGEAIAAKTLGENYRLRGDFLKALELLFRGLSISREIGDEEIEADCLDFMGIAYMGLGEYRMGLNLIFQGMAITHHYAFKPMFPFLLSNIGHAYQNLNMLDSALYFQERARHLTDSMNIRLQSLNSQIAGDLGQIHALNGNPGLAMSYYREAIQVQDKLNLGPSQKRLADLFYTLGQPDSSLHYARLGFVNCRRALEAAEMVDASRLLVKIFIDRKMIDSAFHYQSIAMAITDSLFSPQKFNRLQLLAIREQQNQYEIIQKQKEAEQEREKLANQVRMYGLLAALAVFLLIAVILFRNNRQKQTANAVLNRQKNELAQALTDLKTTQAQLVQSEKMASLGELTAGIAHEIQNPLNFVNNFAELNRELIYDMNFELDRDNFDEVKRIAKDIATNEEKIGEHGKRADSIVKGMLLHSRVSSGTREPTDINALCDEYLRLCYHGLRAKDKSFNANIETHFDAKLPKINVVPQDMGRVLLNICNNAFYAVNERRARENGSYQPTVKLTTRALSENSIEIIISDNGFGIPQKVMEKIFQPFFTTKPTGQGTGLGLSMSYDIIKAHGGEIKVSTKEGEGSEFIVRLPAI